MLQFRARERSGRGCLQLETLPHRSTLLVSWLVPACQPHCDTERNGKQHRSKFLAAEKQLHDLVQTRAALSRACTGLQGVCCKHAEALVAVEFRLKPAEAQRARGAEEGHEKQLARVQEESRRVTSADLVGHYWKSSE